MSPDARDEGIIRDILERVDDSAEISQRDLAGDLGIALGMANAYMKRCVRKGWVKVNQAPTRRYRYYLTPKGFTEKSRLTAQYLRDSLKFFRRARRSYNTLFADLAADGVARVVLCGDGELAEIAVLCALDHPLEIIGVSRSDGFDEPVCGVPAIVDGAPPEADAWVLAETDNAEAAYRRACGAVGTENVMVPSVLKKVLRRRP